MDSKEEKLQPEKYVLLKNWDELTADEKIERMRGQIKQLQGFLGHAQTTIHNLRRKLSKHEHIDSKVVEKKEITEYDNEASGLVGSAAISNSNFF